MASKTGQEKVRRIVTDRILEQLAQGVIPWRKPWVGGDGAWNRRNGKPYIFINQMLLGSPGEYATMRQINLEGGKVNKGVHGSYVLEWICTNYHRKDDNGNVIMDEDTGEPMEFKRWAMRYEKVFNIETDTTLEMKYHKDMFKRFEGKPIDIAEKCFGHYVDAQGITLSHDNKARAFYSPSVDLINLPELSQFEVVEEYYSTAFHEAAHSTGHSSRLDRLKDNGGMRSKSYGKEELVAELTAAAVCNALGIELDSTFQNSASYINSWTKAIKGGDADIISASGFADKAFDMILDGFAYVAEEKTLQPPETIVIRAGESYDSSVMTIDPVQYLGNRGIMDIRKLVKMIKGSWTQNENALGMMAAANFELQKWDIKCENSEPTKSIIQYAQKLQKALTALKPLIDPADWQRYKLRHIKI